MSFTFGCEYSESDCMSVFSINVPRWLASKLDGSLAYINYSFSTVGEHGSEHNKITIKQMQDYSPVSEKIRSEEPDKRLMRLSKAELVYRLCEERSARLSLIESVSQNGHETE